MNLPEQFLKNVAKHKLTVLHDDGGYYRHLKFIDHENAENYFYLITWPGSLVIQADMGCYMFSRIEDMFAFFRREDQTINPSYWSQKVQAADCYCPVREFDIKTALANMLCCIEDWPTPVKEYAVECVESCTSTDEFMNVVSCFCSDEIDYHDGNTYDLTDACLEIEVETFSYHFLWCLHAIVWGISVYDKSKDNDLPSC